MTRLEQLRIDAGLTAQQLAKDAGVSYQTVLNIESGLGARVDTLHKLADALNAAEPEDGLKVRPSELLRPAVWPDSERTGAAA